MDVSIQLISKPIGEQFGKYKKEEQKPEQSRDITAHLDIKSS
jgi:hypothetical protein